MGIVGYIGIAVIVCTIIYGVVELCKYYKEKKDGK
jgi:hypothetical protein